MRALSADTYVSALKRWQSSWTRRPAVRHAATRPFKSARFQSGVRTWFMMIFSESSASTPLL